MTLLLLIFSVSAEDPAPIDDTAQLVRETATEIQEAKKEIEASKQSIKCIKLYLEDRVALQELKKTIPMCTQKESCVHTWVQPSFVKYEEQSCISLFEKAFPDMQLASKELTDVLRR